MLRLITPAASEPITILDARNHCRASDAEDDILALYVATALQSVRDDTGRALLTETWCYSAPSFGCRPITLTRAPLLAVTSVQYWSPDGVDTTLDPSAYQVEAPSGPCAVPGRVMPAAGLSWPDVQCDRADAVRITYSAGYGTEAKDVPSPLRAAALLMVGSMYEYREADAIRALTENPAVGRLLRPYRLNWI